jgi:hypothetical protein
MNFILSAFVAWCLKHCPLDKGFALTPSGFHLTSFSSEVEQGLQNFV